MSVSSKSSKSYFKKLKKFISRRRPGSSDPNCLDTPLLPDGPTSKDANQSGDLVDVSSGIISETPSQPAQHREASSDTLDRSSVNLPHLPAQLFNDTVFTASNLDLEHKLIMAADYISDAIHGRNLQVIPTDQKQKFALQVISHWVYDGLIVSTIIFHMVLGAFEDPTNSSKDSMLITWIDFSVNFLYLADIFVGIMALGWKRFLTKKWNQVRCAIVCFMLFGDNPYR